MNAIQNRHLGCLLGLACGDAVGTTVEFKPRGSFAPLTETDSVMRTPRGNFFDFKTSNCLPSA